MAIVGRRIDNNTMEFDEQFSSTNKKISFERGFLEEQRKNIVAQRDEMIALKEKELAEIDGYLAEMDKNGIVVKFTSEKAPM